MQGHRPRKDRFPFYRNTSGSKSGMLQIGQEHVPSLWGLTPGQAISLSRFGSMGNTVKSSPPPQRARKTSPSSR